MQQQTTNTLPRNLINYDVSAWQDRNARRRARIEKLQAERRNEIIRITRRFAAAVLLLAAGAIVSHMASADSDKKTLIARAAVAPHNLKHASDCYGSQSYLDASNRPEHLVSPEMAVFITLYGQGGDLTECDMQ